MVLMAAVMLCGTMNADDYQLPDPHFEDWTGATFKDAVQPKYWHGSNVEQVGFKFNFTYRETGRTGYCVMVKDQEVGAMGITEVGPGYFSLGTAWQHLNGLNTNSATAGTYGGHAFTHRPDSVSVWIKRTGPKTANEDFHILYYSWSGTAEGSSYKSKSGDCTSVTNYDEESDIRVALDKNECKIVTAGHQIAEGWIHERAEYNDWVNIRVPIFYLNNDAPEKCNLIFSASNYPNFRANSGLYKDNALYVDDVELIYSSIIQKLFVNDKEWKGFDPYSSAIQEYALGQDATMPRIEARRGAGSLTNVPNQSTTRTQDFPGRVLSGNEISIVYGDLQNVPTVITVRAEDGSSQHVYKIQFKQAASTNTKLANVYYTFKDKDNKVQYLPVTGFSPTKYNYTISLPYGTTSIPQISADKQEDEQSLTFVQPNSTTGTGRVIVTAADGTTNGTYTFKFELAPLADNTLKDIKVNGSSVIGFTPSQTVYKVSLPTSTTSLNIEPVSDYPAGAQTIVVAPNPLPTGEAINGSSVTISVTTPGNAIPKVYKLNIKLEASSYSYLDNLMVQGEQIKKVNPASPTDETALGFEPEQLTYFVTLKMGTTSLPQILYTRGDSYQTVNVSELGAGVVDGTVRVTVTAASGDQTVYKLVFSTEKSSNSSLNGIAVGGVALEDFDPNRLSYNYALPVGTSTLPEITWTKGDEYQQVALTTAGVNGKTRIAVTAGDGTTTIYIISFSVATFSDNTLAALSVPGYELLDNTGALVSFDPQTNEYWVNIPKGVTELPQVNYTLQNADFQTASERRPTSLNGDYKLTVRPSSGASRTYIIHFSQDKSTNTALAAIYLDGMLLDGFNPETLTYIDSLEAGVSRLPNVTFDKAESVQRVLSVLENKVQTITVTAESGATRVYTITFIVQMSENAFLDMIYLDSVALPGFRRDSLDYIVQMTNTTCPAITVDKAPGQQVTITAPYGAGDAFVKVQPESGSANVYKITFKATAAATVRLSDLLVDGVSIDGFDPAVIAYDASYSTTLPNVQGVAANAGQTVSETLWNDSVAWVHVTDTLGNKAAYSITFHRVLLTENGLESITADGVQLGDFASMKYNYNYELAAGSTYPEISYVAKPNVQVVFFGQTGEGQWTIKTAAENGAQATYTVTYTIAKYSDVTLENLTVEGMSLGYQPTKTNYSLTLPQGVALPEVTATPKAGQTVLVSTIDNEHQQVIVTAENGNSNTYYITYTRVLSTEVQLKNILIDGVSLAGFDPNVSAYTDSIAWRSTVVPNIFPIAKLDNQTITTEYCRPNGTAKITVEAQDGSKGYYTIAFPMRKSNNAALGDLSLGTTETDLVPTFKPNVLEYTVTMPEGATECAALVFEKAEAEQRIDLISRPLGEISEIIVTAEDGTTQTYKVHFQATQPKEENRLKMISLKIDNDPEQKQELSLKDKTKRNFTVDVPFGTRALDVEYEKYDWQTVFVKPGGVHNPTVITVKANNDTVPDETYTITPNMPTADPAVLTQIKINGTPIANFNSEQFSYIVPVTSKPVLRYTVNKGAEIDILEQTTKHWKANVTYGNRTNTYEVWYYYTNDVVPNADFTTWVDMEVYKGDPKSGWADIYYDNREHLKPQGWNTVGDALDKDVWMGTMYFYPSELISNNSGKVHLTSVYGDGLGGTIPAFITLGKVTGSYGRFGATTFNIGSGISFHNSPDQMILTYNSSEIYEHNLIQYTLYGMEGDTTLTWSDTQTSSELKTVTFDLSVANETAGDPTSMNIVLCAAHQIGGFNMNHHTTMDIDRIQMTFNHTLSGIKVDGVAATKSGNKFSYTLSDPERIEKPILAFNGEVKDQSPLVNWADPIVDGDFSVRTATIRNFAENGTDYTDYTLEVKRPLDTKKTLDSIYVNGAKLAGFNPDATAYTVNLSPLQRIPDVQPFAASSLETITMSFDKTKEKMTINVTSEKGETTSYVITFARGWSDNATLKAISAEGLTPAFTTTEHNYTITAAQWPIIKFEKQSDLQRVTLNNGVITVTAEDGTTTGTYNIVRHDPAVTVGGSITKFTVGDLDMTDFGGTITSVEKAKPTEHVSFVREVATDSIAFIQRETGMEWRTPTTNYLYTYPTTQSANAQLAQLVVDGMPYNDFNPGNPNDTCEIESDTTMLLLPIAAEPTQTVQTVAAIENGAIVYTITVTAANGTNQNIYKVRVSRPQSDVATLKAIYLDGTLLEGFVPTTTDYTVTLPTPVYKTAQPTMPVITYEVGQHGQTVVVTPTSNFGEPNEISVTAEKGNDLTYLVTVNAEPSHCVDLSGITVNGEAVDLFEPGRHYYSVSLKTNDVQIAYTSKDNFQTITREVITIRPNTEYTYRLNVTAEDGVSKAFYEVKVYIENQLNDAQLANITLDGKNFVDFERALNADLTFDGGNNNYLINLPSGTTILPEVNAQLKMEGQSVSIDQRNDSILLDVTAMDGTTHNTYVLRFVVPKSTNADLSMIFLDGAELPGFQPNKYFYVVPLAEGVHEMPEVVGQKSEATQVCDTVWDRPNQQVALPVTAEDVTVTNTYNIVFQYTRSAADTLLAIYADGVKMAGFEPHKLHYMDSLEVGTLAFPDLSWEEVNEWQTIRLDTVSMSPDSTQLVRSITVTAENGRSNTYIVSYVIRKSDINTLQKLIVDQKELVGFQPLVEEYMYMLTAEQAKALDGALPTVEYIEGDEYQTIMIAQAPDTLSGKTLGYKSIVTVTAATGSSRTYTIHYPVEKSTESTLNMVMTGGQPISNYDSERFNYKLEVEMGAAIPVVSVIKKEDAQTYEIRVVGDTVLVDVWAEDVNYTSTYTLAFERILSSVTTLDDIILRDEFGTRYTMSQFPFRSDEFSYSEIDVDFEYGRTLEELLPSMEFVLADSMQTVDTAHHVLPNGDILVEVKVTAPNGDDEGAYALTFHYLRPAVATLISISVDGEELEEFRPHITEYVISHPYGTDSTDYYTIDEITYELTDSLATDTIFMDEAGIIYITVTAQNGTTEMTYMISQRTALDGDNALAWISLDSVMLRDFDPDVTFYTYYLLPGGAAPNVDAETRSANAEWSKRDAAAGDTCMIICTAADGSERRYYIHFAYTPVDPGKTATGNDVIIKRVPGAMQIFVGAIRQGVNFILYDQNGHVVYTSRVPVANPNDTEIYNDLDNREKLNNIVDMSSGLIIDINPRQPYFYVFFADEKTKIAGGKLMALP